MTQNSLGSLAISHYCLSFLAGTLDSIQWEAKILCSVFYWLFLAGKRDVAIVDEGSLKIVGSL